MTPEELDKARVVEARRLWGEMKAGGPLDKSPQPIEIAARLAREGWQPTPKPSPRVMAMREWLIANGYGRQQTEAGEYDSISSCARAFLAGYAAAVKEAEPLLDTIQHLEVYPALARDYLTAIGEERP